MFNTWNYFRVTFIRATGYFTNCSKLCYKVINMKKLRTTILTLILLSSFLIIFPATTSSDIRVKPPVPPGKNKAPKVKIDTPHGSKVSGIVLITVTETDKEDGNLIADIYIDGSFVIHANEYEWESTTFADGLHIIEAVAYDSTEKQGSDTITVTVDNGSPLPHHLVIIMPLS